MHAAAAVVGVDRVRLAMERVGPVVQPALRYAGDDLVELRLADQEGMVRENRLAPCAWIVECPRVLSGHGQPTPSAANLRIHLRRPWSRSATHDGTVAGLSIRAHEHEKAWPGVSLPRTLAYGTPA